MNTDSASRIFMTIAATFILLWNAGALWLGWTFSTLEGWELIPGIIMIGSLIAFIAGIYFGIKHKWTAALGLIMVPTIVTLLWAIL